MIRPRRVSMGCYAVTVNGATVILQRLGRSGFRIVLRPGAMTTKKHRFRRLGDAAAAAIEMVEPWPFPVERKFDGLLDIPQFLRRTA